MVTTGLVAGVLVAAALIAATVALAPQPVPLRARIRTTLEPDLTPSSTEWVARWRRRLVPADDRIVPALAITGTSVEQLALRRLAWTVGGALAPMLAWPAGLVALGAPPAAAPLAGLIGGAVGWWLAIHELHDQADKRRREMNLALASYLSLTAIMIRGGAGPEQALRDTAQAGSGWTFDALRRPIAQADEAGVSPWHAFDDLGRELGMIELRALGSQLRIASHQGSSPARTLAARAAALRAEELATQLSEANRAEQRMSAPLVGLGLCVVVFIVFPALMSVLSP